MVTRRAVRLGRRRGASSTGCLVSLLVFVNIGEVFLRYYRFLDEVKTQARLAAAIDDGTIRRRLEASADHIGLPEEARQITIRRSASPREIRIESRYSETVDLPLFHHTFRFHPRATHPL
jgi:hypothetical protein